MARYALWYFKPLNGNYATFNTNIPVSELGRLGFDYVICLHATGRNGEYGQMPMSGYSYEDGYNDGKALANWLEETIDSEIQYLVEIPVLVKDDKEQWEVFKSSGYTIKPPTRKLNYWIGWIEGVYTHTGSLQKGFYWNLEFPWQIIRGIINEGEISTVPDKISDLGQQFIWIPYGHEGINLEHTDIKTIAKYFTYIFVQPNYYKGKTEDFDEWSYLFNSFRQGHNLNNVFMEMECDNGVQSGGCFNNKSPEECIRRACEYVRYARNYPHRAYYYGADIQNLQIMKQHCPGYLI